ncbi:hypothetical protein GUJ93_ZPchr0008g13057 [Zizania palustris]|uniref:Uncharacterized protein n=1 Tax=Zizania palustris TaxID=103762 RepID=A0A8J5R0B4_ZIZPA|nr:hypothetical protein GUJ93_ZPchr0008g13057 [Zizania palustris]
MVASEPQWSAVSLRAGQRPTTAPHRPRVHGGELSSIPWLGGNPVRWGGGLERGYLVDNGTEGHDEGCLCHGALVVHEGSIIRAQI